MDKGDTSYLSKNIPHTVSLCENTSYAKALIIYKTLLKKTNKRILL